ncbi:alpha-D-ribose 1-methylphosphonate 5-triphosphate diphosphatase [Tropicimonas sp. S265A]|uniref:alpha-D-ribose 1-methylphosphonate 5-triphosphate diphosphatase n=1 Tax=Tropicimonas sp. S265A TaxID=3415134 RepID=UPI003C7C8A7F
MPDLLFDNAAPFGADAPPLAMQDGRLCAPASGMRRVDCDGFMVLPGIVDLHGDGFERHLAPRRGAVADLGEGLRAVDAELAANGITTAVLAQFWSWEGGMRGPAFARALAEALQIHGARLKTRMILQLRLETHTEDGFAAAEAFVAEAGIDYVVLNDHLPHRALAAGKRPPRLTGQALKSGRSPEAHLALLQQLHRAQPHVEAALPGLCARLRARGVRLGSHDDPTPERRATLRAMGVRIAEFPETEAAARAAHDAGDAVILGAPNVMRGGSHKDNLRAQDMVTTGVCDALVSDYHYPSVRQAVFRLVREGFPRSTAWSLVSANPAKILGLCDRGGLHAGQRADLVVLDAQTHDVGATFVGGRVSYAAGVFAERLMEAV